MNRLEQHLHRWGVSIFLSHSHWTDGHTEARDITFSYLHCLRGSWTLEQVSLPQLARSVCRQEDLHGWAPGSWTGTDLGDVWSKIPGRQR